jgi:hypothetical protein
MLSGKEGEMGRTKIITIFVIVFSIIIHYSVAQAQRDLSALLKKVTPSVVVINVFDKDGKLKGSGTGFFVKEDGTQRFLFSDLSLAPPDPNHRLGWSKPIA